MDLYYWPVLGGLKEAPTYLKFLRELLSKKGKLEEDLIENPMGEVCSAILLSKSPSKLRDLGSVSIPYAIGDLQIEGALCELGACVSLIALSLCRKLHLYLSLIHI